MAIPEHLELSDYIKKVHKDLRTLSERIGSSEAWEHHCKQEEVLKGYAEKMYALATTYWEKNNKNDGSICRIQWVFEQCCKYFIDSGYEMEVKREAILIRKHLHEQEHSLMKTLEGSRFNLSDKINLLDVGSCYNPFERFEMFKVLAVDLYPATDDVFKCDFIKVALSNQLIVQENEIKSMQKEFFQVVVFSLLLEYFPDPAQRYICCEKAYNLLCPNGVLFILTPDSNHATANSKLMKEWRISLASLGFFRIHYQKLKHLHCLMFRKNVVKELPVRWFNMKNVSNSLPQSMLAIPQDRNEQVDNQAENIYSSG